MHGYNKEVIAKTQNQSKVKSLNLYQDGVVNKVASSSKGKLRHQN